MRKLNSQQVEHVADLAKLSLNKDELQMFQKQLGEILDYIDKLEEVDTIGTEPTSQVTGAQNIVRKDVAKQSMSGKEALSGAKNIFRGMFKVKAIFEQ